MNKKPEIIFLPKEKKQALKILWSILETYPHGHIEREKKIKEQIERVEKWK